MLALSCLEEVQRVPPVLYSDEATMRSSTAHTAQTKDAQHHVVTLGSRVRCSPVTEFHTVHFKDVFPPQQAEDRAKPGAEAPWE